MKKYYSSRTGKNSNSSFDLPSLKRLFKAIYQRLEKEGYFQEYFGYNCVDRDFVSGKLGEDIASALLLSLKKDNLWPINSFLDQYSEDDLFDIMEFLLDHISKPKLNDRDYHSYYECGYHYTKFDKSAGQKEFIEKINELLPDYSTGFELSSDGFILTKESYGLNDIFDANIRATDEIKDKIAFAIKKYRQSRTDMNERKTAIRELADLCEQLRGDIKQLLNQKDENDLFNIANKFAIRHSNENQQPNYDKNIWYAWMFYFYLSTIYAVLAIKERK